MEDFDNVSAIEFDIDTVFTNKLVKDKVGHIKNFICLLTKQYIYSRDVLEKI